MKTTPIKYVILLCNEGGELSRRLYAASEEEAAAVVASWVAEMGNLTAGDTIKIVDYPYTRHY